MLPLAATTQLSSVVLLKPSDGFDERVRTMYDSIHAARFVLGVAHARKNIALANRCSDLVFRCKDKFHVTVHHVFGHAGNVVNECADCAASLGSRGLVSHDNLPSRLPGRRLLIHPLLSVPHCLSRVAEMFTESRR